MPRLRRLSSNEVIGILTGLGFKVHSQQGSHIKLVFATRHGHVGSVIVPRHSLIGPGLLRAIFREASQFVPEESLRGRFYTG